MAQRRRAYEPGHRPKVLVVIDDTAECMRAAAFAARRARRTGAMITLLAVIMPGEEQPWRGIGSLMQAEAEAEAQVKLARASALIEGLTGFHPEQVIRTGNPAEEVMKLIEADADIAVLVLASGTGKEGPGPLVSLLAGRLSAHFPVPVTLVPGGLDEADFEALA
jgi:nucleotide-binding universal stress UspA family protein